MYATLTQECLIEAFWAGNAVRDVPAARQVHGMEAAFVQMDSAWNPFANLFYISCLQMHAAHDMLLTQGLMYLYTLSQQWLLRHGRLLHVAGALSDMGARLDANERAEPLATE